MKTPEEKEEERHQQGHVDGSLTEEGLVTHGLQSIDLTGEVNVPGDADKKCDMKYQRGDPVDRVVLQRLWKQERVIQGS